MQFYANFLKRYSPMLGGRPRRRSAQAMAKSDRVNSNRSSGALSQVRNEVPTEAHEAAFLLASLDLRRPQTVMPSIL
jgi:hypothetical protein